MTTRRWGKAHNNYLGVPDRVPVRKVKVAPSLRTVECPTCHAQPGEPCLGKTGAATTLVHVARRRMALRAEQAGG